MGVSKRFNKQKTKMPTIPPLTPEDTTTKNIHKGYLGSKPPLKESNTQPVLANKTSLHIPTTLSEKYPNVDGILIGEIAEFNNDCFLLVFRKEAVPRFKEEHPGIVQFTLKEFEKLQSQNDGSEEFRKFLTHTYNVKKNIGGWIVCDK